uniref:pyridoxamine 5'-phosphate oxidase family protein n=1 Tax=Nocardia wallacei TaxID=480035 RepID=UPI0024549DC0
MPDARCGSDGERELQERYGTRDRAQRFAREQVLDRLNAPMIDFVRRMDMAFIATSDRHGECDASFRAGTPGFLHVIDERTLAYPELRGNGVLASLGNLLENPHIGILLIDFVRDLIGLHINGSAHIVDDVALRRWAPGVPPGGPRPAPPRGGVGGLGGGDIPGRPDHAPPGPPAPAGRRGG